MLEKCNNCSKNLIFLKAFINQELMGLDKINPKGINIEAVKILLKIISIINTI